MTSPLDSCPGSSTCVVPPSSASSSVSLTGPTEGAAGTVMKGDVFRPRGDEERDWIDGVRLVIALREVEIAGVGAGAGVEPGGGRGLRGGRFGAEIGLGR